VSKHFLGYRAGIGCYLMAHVAPVCLSFPLPSTLPSQSL
jgi:hypothetical protein